MREANCVEPGVQWGGSTLLLLVLCTGCQNPQVIDAPTERVKEINRITEVKELLSILTDDPVALNRAAAATSLERLGDARAVEPLIAGLEDSDAGVRRDCASALGVLADRRATRPLCRVLLRDPIADVRRVSARSLHKIGDPKAVVSLVRALTDPNESVVHNAHRALKEITNHTERGRSPSEWADQLEQG